MREYGEDLGKYFAAEMKAKQQLATSSMRTRASSKLERGLIGRGFFLLFLLRACWAVEQCSW